MLQKLIRMSRNQYARRHTHTPDALVIECAKVAVKLFHVKLLISPYGVLVLFCLWWVWSPSWGPGNFHGEVNRSVWLWLCGSTKHMHRHGVPMCAWENCTWIHTPGSEPIWFGEVLLIKPSFLRSFLVFQLHSDHVQWPQSLALVRPLDKERQEKTDSTHTLWLSTSLFLNYLSHKHMCAGMTSYTTILLHTWDLRLYSSPLIDNNRRHKERLTHTHTHTAAQCNFKGSQTGR